MEGLHPGNISDIIADRKRYDDVLYTPLARAYEELERRRKDPVLEGRVIALLRGNVPEPLRERPRAVISRSVISPNYEVRRFTGLVEEFGKIEPLFWEYPEDKFTSNNELKRMLAKLYFFHGTGRNNGPKLDLINILDFSKSDGKKFTALRTLWGESFIDFHHNLFDACHKKVSHEFFDSSQWLGSFGGNAEAYYKPFLLLFVRHAIMFENVQLNKEEIGFTTRTFLPTFLSIHRELGLKPLIVPLAPTNTEVSRHWLCYPGQSKAFVDSKIVNTA